ncbi:uroporphyrinogen-III synthase [Henriciella sp. AS95]|uniref:uroporphyrinogen-III synthase n=1 Tax=Henriciella sp. AS95 TaxID=3135782 RepID=UPI00316EF4B8
MIEPAKPIIIITRAEPGASQTAARLGEMGLPHILSPAIELAARDEALPDPSQYAGLIFTSANGVRFFSDVSEVRDLPAWCVGPATASEAVREAFSPVHQSSGDAHDLAHFIAHHWHAHTPKKLLHIANAAAKGMVKQALENEGFEVDFVPLYEARPAACLAADADDALRSGQNTIVLIHSAKGAEAFLGLAKQADLSKTRFVTISEQAARPLQAVQTGGVTAASHPDEDHLLETLEKVLANR